MDKRERQRLERARLRKARARRETEVLQARAHRWRADELADAAARSLRARDLTAAVDHAARAVALTPRDRFVAALYAQAAEASGSLRHRIAALEHLAEIATPAFGLLATLADLHVTAGNCERARRLLLEARGALRRRRARREDALGFLRDIEERLATRSGASARVPADPGAQPRQARPPQARAATARQDARPAPLTLPVRPPAPAVASPVLPSPPESRRDSSAPPPATAAASGTAPRRCGPAAAAPHACPPRFEIPVALAPAIAGLDALATTPYGAPEDVTLALLATSLRNAESFDRLLALEHARGLLRLSHQEETARKVLAVFLGRALLADEVGLGKTIEAALVLSEYFLRGHVQRALVLAPPSLVGQWREELASKFGITTRSTEDEAWRRDPARLWDGSGIVIASLATARAERHREAVTGRAWDLVIVDEAHTLKNHRTESYALVERLKSRFLLLLTATPVENRVEELYNLVSLIRPGHLGGRGAFVRRFTGRDGNLTEAARGELRGLLGELMIRNTRALSGVHLPPRFARTLLVAPGPEEGALYEQLAAALRSLRTAGRMRSLLSLLLQEAGSSPFAVRGTLARLYADTTLPDSVRAPLASAVEFAAQATGSEKSRALVEALASAPGPAIVFTRFRGTLAFLADVLERAGVPHERLDGDVPPAERAALLERCHAGGGVLLSTDVGSEGLNLQFCHRLVNFDLPWNPMRIEQRIGRLHRIGQEHPVEVLNLCLAGSIEERILQILDERINLFELVVGEVEMILGYLEGGGEFPELVLDAFAEPTDADRQRSFTRLGDALAAARQRYRAVKSFDEALFRSELGV